MTNVKIADWVADFRQTPTNERDVAFFQKKDLTTALAGALQRKGVRRDGNRVGRSLQSFHSLPVSGLC